MFIEGSICWGRASGHFIKGDSGDLSKKLTFDRDLKEVVSDLYRCLQEECSRQREQVEKS